MNQLNLIKQKNISQVVKDFLTCELYSQRKTIINLLLPDDNPEFQYLAYLLYDLMSNDVNGNIDTHEQTSLFDSLPWNIKKKFVTGSTIKFFRLFAQSAVLGFAAYLYIQDHTHAYLLN